MYPLDDTIAAIASPPGGAARGIVRISGPQALDCLTQLFQPDGRLPSPDRRSVGARRGDRQRHPTPLPALLRLAGTSLAASVRRLSLVE